MRIIDKIADKTPFISLEFFPPKEPDAWDAFFAEVEKLKALDPLFVSVTYGAGGAGQDNTLAIVKRLKQDHGLEPMAHLTCVGASEAKIKDFVAALKAAEVDNVLALRGDPPRDVENFCWDNEDFRYACDLAALIARFAPDMGIGVAGYPTPHPEATSAAADLEALKAKLDAGGQIIVSQLFFDNQVYFRYVETLRGMGVTAPVIPGILPILSKKSIDRILSMCAVDLPADLARAIDEADAKGGAKAVREVGVNHAREQVRELLKNGAPGAHLYTLNKADVCLAIMEDDELRGLVGLA